MSELPDELLCQLLDLIDRLRAETQDFLEELPDQQTWYNRGYANGMLLALRDMTSPDRLTGRLPDDPDRLGGHLAMPWGKAYRHGEQVGSRETHEITGTPKA